ncbi:peroxisomal N(1)-acetyl-spermine/spermidine oxidase-like [Sitodiplosis mosellana]|uniref:peroxisomal N(1)-acetyl-spermine/spermidine oxidase-like n=1 Tax=Sitodiplosis mosellana TaxID=263140 RepID=UPI0024439A57|nr:peroxisomal N(1)-acetyl-spermine/spermidine oxidase-like [Sitodiplosis mosellana]
MEQKSDADVKSGVEKVLRMFVKQWDIPNAKAMIRSKWHSNLHFRGSYSNNTLKSDALDVSAEKLRDPINESNGRPVIQFAGEATNPNHYASVHRAIETGWHEADRLIQLYK